MRPTTEAKPFPFDSMLREPSGSTPSQRSFLGARRLALALVLALPGLALLGTPTASAQEPDDEEWTFEEDLRDDALDDELLAGDPVDDALAQEIGQYAHRLYRNRQRGYEQVIEGMGYLRELSFNASMRATKKDFFELLGESLGELILGGFGADLPDVAGLELGDLPALSGLLEAWGEEVSPSPRMRTVGDWVQAEWDRLRLAKADLPDPDDLTRELEDAYPTLDLDSQIDFEIWVDEALENEQAYREPDPLLVEQRFWEHWINAHFDRRDLATSTCHDTGGCLEIWFEAEEYLLHGPDLRLAAADVVVPDADVVRAGLRRILEQADQPDRGAWRRRVHLLDFAVPKRVCFGSYDDWAAAQPQPIPGLEGSSSASRCGWLGPDNQTWSQPEDPDVRELFAGKTWRQAGGGATLEVVGWD